MSKVRKAIIYSAASRYIVCLIGLVSTMIIARLLTPAEVGTYALASAIVMVMSEIRLLGAGSYLVREKEMTDLKIRSAFGLTILMSWGLALLIVVMAPFVADFYNIAEVANIFWILAAGFLVAPYISIPISLLTRHFQFKGMFYVAVTGSLSNFVFTVAFIKMDFSFYALAIGQTLSMLAQVVVVLLFWPKGMPWAPLFSDLKRIAAFGVFSSVGGLVRRATVIVSDLVIGKMGTTTEVGMFSRGLGFIDFISQTVMMGINPVVLPFLADTRRNGRDLAAAYIRASVMLTGLVWPVLIVASLVSVPAIRLFFGDQWDAAAPVATWLAWWGVLRSAHWMSNGALLAVEAERLMVIKELAVFFVFLFGIIIAYPYGLEMVAASFVVSGAIDVIVTFFLLSVKIELSWIAYLRASWPTIATTAVCGAAALGIGQLFPYDSPNFWKPIGVVAAVLPVVWLASMKVFGHPLYEEVMKVIQAILHKTGIRSFGD